MMPATASTRGKEMAYRTIPVELWRNIARMSRVAACCGLVAIILLKIAPNGLSVGL
jgi:hypothetical protein